MIPGKTQTPSGKNSELIFSTMGKVHTPSDAFTAAILVVLVWRNSVRKSAPEGVVPYPSIACCTVARGICSALKWCKKEILLEVREFSENNPWFVAREN